MAEKHAAVQRVRLANDLHPVRLYARWLAGWFTDRWSNFWRSAPAVVCVCFRTGDKLASTHATLRQVSAITSLSFRIACPFTNHAIPNATIATVSGQKIDRSLLIAFIATIAI